ncbi:nitroreductase [Clostridium moniliforme]|uniref:Nitroreductase n=1 Tax=Clostridium moniliforme TaxID=39489 RepID=A0ABS4F0C8_9CLOT|nr:nitroreductase family protein [Clostridium moniliforme]MBP1889706.1 nitroreductase [Clostridium moniliforme]
MNFYDVINNRKSVSKYKGYEICRGSLNNMIEAAMKSPTWKNRTSFKLILLEDKNIKDIMAEFILNSDNKAEEALKEAPMALVVIAEPEKSGEVDGKEFYIADGAIAMEHFILAATAEGYGTMWIGALKEEKIKALLNIPDEFKIIGVTPIGVSAEVEPHNEKKDIKEYVFSNKFNNPYKYEID